MTNELLLLNYESLQSRSAKLFFRLGNNEEYRREFIRNPMGIIYRHVLGKSGRASSGSLSAENRMLYALLSNPKFNVFMENISAEIKRDFEENHSSENSESVRRYLQTFDKQKIYSKLVAGVKEFADTEYFFTSATRNIGAASVSEDDEPDLDDLLTPDCTVDVEFCVYAFVLIGIFILPVDFTAHVGEDPSDFTTADLRRASDKVIRDLIRQSERVRDSNILVDIERLTSD